jgi:hypothetical protein
VFTKDLTYLGSFNDQTRATTKALKIITNLRYVTIKAVISFLVPIDSKENMFGQV